MSTGALVVSDDWGVCCVQLRCANLTFPSAKTSDEHAVDGEAAQLLLGAAWPNQSLRAVDVMLLARGGLGLIACGVAEDAMADALVGIGVDT